MSVVGYTMTRYMVRYTGIRVKTFYRCRVYYSGICHTLLIISAFVTTTTTTVTTTKIITKSNNNMSYIGRGYRTARVLLVLLFYTYRYIFRRLERTRTNTTRVHFFFFFMEIRIGPNLRRCWTLFYVTRIIFHRGCNPSGSGRTNKHA